ncbi:MAG: para-aminobenzoate synthetase component 1 [Planctomycetota bacterium]|jgi:para-aminobenzoate synthetase component 1
MATTKMSAPYRFTLRAFEVPLAELYENLAIEPGPDGHFILAQALKGVGVQRRPVLLDSAAGWPRNYSLLALDPVETDLPQSLGELATFAKSFQIAAAGERIPGPFHGGFVGALAYDLGVEGESVPLPPEPWGLPHIVGGVYTDFIVYLGEEESLWIVLGLNENGDKQSVEARRQSLVDLLRKGLTLADGATSPKAPLNRHTPSAVHEERIEEVRMRIGRGEFYQANLAHRFTRSIEGAPADLYGRLRTSNPAPYAGYMSWPTASGSAAIMSSSPELLLELKHVGDRREARSRPIKGTAPRSTNPVEDKQLAEALQASAKDRAELAMIVDLERNDLGRTARTGSVYVEEFPALRSYERVHHLTADVVSEPREDCDAFDVLAAVFPGGSVTGAPKLASMAAIAELEGEGRGFFCGSLGFVDSRGESSFNLLIRTVIWRSVDSPGQRQAGEVSFRVGGGITWSSNPADEDAETLAKASGMLAAFETGSPINHVREQHSTPENQS